jgi:hypothetical protein
LGVIETESDDAAEARIKKDMTREKPWKLVKKVPGKW